MTDFTPRRVLVLGGGSEIAEHFVGRCVDRGADHIVLAGRPGGSVDGVAERLSTRHADASIVARPFDATESERHGAVLAALDERDGPFDTVLVAFGELGEPFTLDVTPAEAARLIDVNFTGAASATLASLNVLRGEPGARLIVISSIIAVRPRVGNLAYAAAKAGLDGFALELAGPASDVGVDVVVVRPGYVHTRMTEGRDPAPFATTPDVVADDMIGGLDRGRSVIHSPATLAPVGLVLKNLPGPVWRRIAER